MKTITVGELKEALKDMKDWMPVFIVAGGEVFDVETATMSNMSVSLDLYAPDIYSKMEELQKAEEYSAIRAEDAEQDLDEVKDNVRAVIEDLKSSVATLEDWSR